MASIPTAVVVHGGADRTVMLPDGRKLGYREYGCANGWPVIALHGTPGSRLRYLGSHQPAAIEGLRLIAVDRWSYGLSSVKPGAQLADYGDDIGFLADALRLETFQVIGVSGGAPFAVAVAAQLRQRVTGLALVSPVGPIIELDGKIEISSFHAVCFRLLPRMPGAIAAVFLAYRRGLMLVPNWAMWLAVSRSPTVDQRMMREPSTRSRLIEAFSTGLRSGVQGPVTDMKIFGRSWEVDLDAVSARTCVWIGTADRNVPMTAVKKLISKLPKCQSVVIADAGHLWIAQNADIVMRWLAHVNGNLKQR